ncbi:hypothetical protein FGIG_10305 [Fasciola gigantica]|uniref:Uncharacterized protein n=1 Tax=Fasciola gigantica TaxID=46835 RepID=A0A504YH13_FASGI|nr:hypothetical protein FGIG_10305 [Fasciola gigantica]
MRISYLLMQSGKVVLSDPRSTPVMTNQWASPSANVEHVIPDRKPIYINLTKSITNQLDLPGEKLHSFLLGSSITSELRRLLCYRKCLTRKSNIETSETSEKTANGLNGFSGHNHSPLRTSIGRGGNGSSMRATSCEEDGDLDTSTLYPVVSTITKPMHLHQRSESEGPGYCNAEATVQFTIIGGTRTSTFKQDLSDSTPDPYVKTSPKLSVTTSNSPLNDIYDQTGHCVQSANFRTRVVSIPYDPDHESVCGLNTKCGSMCVIGSRPGSSLPMTKTNMNFAQVTDPETTRSARMDLTSPTFRHSPEKRPYSATGENNESLKVEEVSPRSSVCNIRGF